MRKRLIGVAAVVLIAVGAWLGGLFDKFGVGTGNDEGESHGTPVALVSNTGNSSSETETPTATESAGPTDFVTVVVDGSGYQIQSGDDDHATFAAVKLDEIVSRAADAPGDEHGVKVRVRFRTNAENGAISDLFAALQADGNILREQILEESDFVDGESPTVE